MRRDVRRPVRVITKLYNVLFTIELARRYGPEGVTAVAFDPGFVRTRLGREGVGLFKLFLRMTRPFQRDPIEPARELTALAVAPRAENRADIVGARPVAASALVDGATATKPWEMSSRLVGSETA
jgi:retinol dehydrogenase 12